MTPPVEPELPYTVAYDPALPISAHVGEITELLRNHQVLVVAGETGSGKTTQLPKVLLELGCRRIGHTQPRRLAARSVASRLAEELGVELGTVVGYQVRFSRKATRATRVKVMTDGVLLAEIGHERDLRHYDAIIIDEAHERSLNIDFLLGYLKQLLPRRPDLKVVITSATIDTQRFAEHFAVPQPAADAIPAPIVEVSGRTYPVEVRYRPLPVPERSHDAPDQNEGIVAAVRELGAEGPGDILVFLSGEREIRDAAEALADAKLRDTEVVPLYARLSVAEQHRVFTSHTGRRVVLATNLAETSLTVPGVRYVIDTGLARISRYSSRTKVQRLPIEPISQASANQRAGRCGRVAPGICVRLYDEQDYLIRPEFTEPEILRTNLASVILAMAQAGLGDISSFPFVEAPERAHITDGLRLLDELGALKPGTHRNPQLTPDGRLLAGIPIEPRLGRMLIEAARRGCLREVQVIVAGLAIQDVRERPVEQREQADAAHRRFWSDDVLNELADPSSGTARQHRTPARYTPHTRRADQPTEARPDAGGDLAAMLRMWVYLKRLRDKVSGSQFRRRCRDEYLNYLRIREWQDLLTQLKEICKDLGLKRNEEPASSDAILTSVLAGLLGHVGLKQVDKADGSKPARGRTRRPLTEFEGARGARFAIQPGSALAKHPPALVMAVELVETSRLWARTVAGIQPEWVEQVGAHVVKRSHSEPHWSSSSGSVLAYEKVLLFGVPIIADRLVDYANVDQAQARTIFIRSALVEGQWRPTPHTAAAKLIEHNARVLAEAEDLEERTRRRDLTIDDHARFDFFDAQLPSTVCSTAALEAWLRHQAPAHALELTSADVLRVDGDAVDFDDFPDHWSINGLELPVDYVFDPGAGHDGVTVTVPLAQLNQLQAEPFSWQVPGLRAELATQLIRNLPKQWRTRFVPAPDHARQALRWLASHDADPSRPFCLELSRALTGLTGERVPDDQWAPDQVPNHLQVAFDVVDGGKRLRHAKDFASLRADLAQQVSATLTKAAAERPVVATSWRFGVLKPQITVKRGAVTAVGYPALQDAGTAVRAVLADSPEVQRVTHTAGIVRLLVLNLPDPTRWAIAHLTNADKLALSTNPYDSVPDLMADARLKATAQLAARYADPIQVRTAEQFDALATQVRQAQADQMRAVVATAAATVRNAQQVRVALANLPAGSPTRQDVTAQLDNLVFKKFISFTRDPWFEYLPRYVQAMQLRLQAAQLDPGRDARQQVLIDELEAEFAELCNQWPVGRLADAVEDVGFLIEELRVQTFAQQLRTAVTVSPKRIRQTMESVRATLR